MLRFRPGIFLCLTLSFAATGHCTEIGAAPSDSAILTPDGKVAGLGFHKTP